MKCCIGWRGGACDSVRTSASFRWTCCAVVFSAVSVDAVHAEDVVPSQELRRLVTRYFRVSDAAERHDLLPRIERESEGSIRAVAEAMGSARLWTDPPAARGLMPLRLESIELVDIAYRLPVAYDARGAYPMVLCMPRTRGRGGAAAALGDVRVALGSRADGLVLVAPAVALGGSFHYDDRSEADLPALLREIRRAFHIDSARVFLFGVREGADAAWIAAVMHADQFAGVITVEGYPRVPHPDQVYPFLLENLARLPVLSVYRLDDTGSPSRRHRAVAAHCRAIDALASREGWPIHIVAVGATAGDTVVIPSEAMDALLDASRPPAPKEVSHWFRYPAEGHEHWITQTRFRGDVWEASQLSIVPPVGARGGSFIADVVKDELAYVALRVEGQTIRLETRRCATVSLLLPMSLVDFNEPVSILLNGKRRFADHIIPSIATMLAVARERWEFSRPVVARMKLRVPRAIRSR